MNLANKFRKAGFASAGKLQTCSSSQVAFSEAWLCPVNKVAFRIGPGHVFGGGRKTRCSRKTSLRWMLQVV